MDSDAPRYERERARLLHCGWAAEFLGYKDVKTTMIPGVLYRNHISPIPSGKRVLMHCNHWAYGNSGIGVLYCNFAGKGCYIETI
jgi:hypothetical protein